MDEEFAHVVAYIHRSTGLDRRFQSDATGRLGIYLHKGGADGLCRFFCCLELLLEYSRCHLAERTHVEWQFCCAQGTQDSRVNGESVYAYAASALGLWRRCQRGPMKGTKQGEAPFYQENEM